MHGKFTTYDRDGRCFNCQKALAADIPIMSSGCRDKHCVYYNPKLPESKVIHIELDENGEQYIVRR